MTRYLATTLLLVGGVLLVVAMVAGAIRGGA